MAMAAAIIAPVVSGVLGFVQSSYQAQVAKMNEEIAEENARRARERAAIEAEDSDRETGALIGEQTALQGASGLAVTGKSQVATRRSARQLGRLDTLRIIQAGDVEHYNFKVDAANFKAERKAAKLTGISNLVGGFLGAAGATPSSLIGSSRSTANAGRFVPKPIPKPAVATAPKFVPIPRPKPIFFKRKPLGSLTFGGPR
jgi:hypothetical protein